MPDGAGPSILPADAGPDLPAKTPERVWQRLFRNLKGRRRTAAPLALPDDPAAFVAAASTGEREMMERIAAFREKRVDDVAIPRADIVAVDHAIGIQDLIEAFSAANHSRLPVYRGDLDDPIGMVHLKDVVGLLANGHGRQRTPEPAGADAEGLSKTSSDDADEAEADPILPGLLRKLLYVPPSMPVTELLLRMQASRVHMALVIDEFGGTDGLVTIEDLIELIVGDIRDEHDDGDDFLLRRLSDGRWEASPRVPLEELSDQTGFEMALEEHDADTLGGLVFSLAGRVPLRGEVISHPNGLDFDIVDADPRRIQRIIVRPTRTKSLTLSPDAPPKASEPAP